MDGINKVILLGNIGADPELKTTASGQSLLKLTLATNEHWKDKDNNDRERVEWHRVTVWGKQAEGLAKFLKKGWKVFVEGRIEHSSYERDGQKHYGTDVIANKLLALGAPRTADADGIPYAPPKPNGGFSSPSRGKHAQDEIPF